MRLDIRRDLIQGWLALGTAFVVSLLGLWLAWDGGESETLVEERQTKVADGPNDLAREVAKAREANAKLRGTLSDLLGGVGFSIEEAFRLKEDATYTPAKKGYFFVTKRDSITYRLRQRAQERSIPVYEEYAGFGLGLHRPPSETPPPNEQADDLLHLLQLTDKAVSICLETPGQLQKLLVQPHGTNVKPAFIAAPGRPPLFKEYRLTLEITGGLTDILWIVHRLSPGRDSSAGDYPLILRGLRITSENRTPVESIQQLDCRLEIAGICPLTEEERNGFSATPGSRRVSSSAEAAMTSAANARSF